MFPEPAGSLPALIAGPPRRLDLAAAQDAAMGLASDLLDRYSPEVLASARFLPIPRGGHFVLGMLAYYLNLPPSPTPTTSPLTVVVDDCALSGLRFGEFLAGLPDATAPLVFAHLASNPALRDAIEAREPRVTACIAAIDLPDRSRARFEDPVEHERWRAGWLERAGGERYWIGEPEHLILPWSEPERMVWDSEQSRRGSSWYLAAPDVCLKNWSRLGLPPRPIGRRRFRMAADTAFCLLPEQGQILLCHLDTGEVLGLEGVAAEMWKGLAAYGCPRAALAHIEAHFEVEASTAAADLADLSAALREAGLLEDC
jgi:hypothetical protein